MKMTYEEYCARLGEDPCPRLRAAYDAWSAASHISDAYRDVRHITWGRLRYEGHCTVERVQRRYRNRTGKEVSAETVRQIWRGDGLKVDNDSVNGEKIDE